MKKRCAHTGGLVFALLFLLSAAATHGAGAPIPVSPGTASGPTEISTTCPTFSWAPAAGSTGQELVIYRVKEQGESESEPVRRVVLPGNVGSWTPSLADCLEPENAYAWSVRAEHRDSKDAWSEAGLFQIGTTPSLEEVEAALGVLERYRRSLAPAPPDPAPDTHPHSGRLDIASPPASLTESAVAPLSSTSKALDDGSLFPFSNNGLLVEAEDIPGQGVAAVRGLVAENPVSESLLFRAGVVGEVIGNSGTGLRQWGVLGITNGTDGAGVRGDAVLSTGSARGVIGITNSPDGLAGYFANNNGLIGGTGGTALQAVGHKGIALFAQASPGIALQTEGRVVLGGRVNLEGLLVLTSANTPAICSTAFRGALYYDLGLTQPCYCNGTAWLSVITNLTCT